MRVVIPLPGTGNIVNWHALAAHRTFLYRRVADRQRALLFIGGAPQQAPVFHGHAANDWCYGHMCYDLKDHLEALHSRHDDDPGLALEHWATPRWVVEWTADGLRLHAMQHDQDAGLRFCDELFTQGPAHAVKNDPQWALSTDRDRYLGQVERLLWHIQRGDIYEVNYCIERTARAADFDPYPAFGALLEHTQAPFAAFHRMGDRFALCASPERFLSLEGDRVIAQPMKGTRRRSADPEEDRRLMQELAMDAKERGENIMALDVTRHDLSRIAAQGSVKVEELCAVKAYPRVHQMTSTVSARIRQEVDPLQVLKAAFPMASMTGAPKIRAMQLIDAMEDQRRGLFSGTLGFFAPDGTGDFNVVIRTVFFDAASGTLRLPTGSALTAACDPALEWEECTLKARSVMEALL